MKPERPNIYEVSEKDTDMIHADLLSLISEIKKCNKYMDMFFMANGIYEKAADVILLRRIGDRSERSETAAQSSSL